MRTQSKSVASYIFRNLWQLIILALPLAVLMGAFFGFDSIGTFFSRTFSGDMSQDNYLQQIMQTFLVVRFADSWLGNLITTVVFVFVNSMLVVKIARHMRVGEMHVFPLKETLKLFPAMFLYAATFFLAIQLVQLVVLGLVAMLDFTGNVSVLVSMFIVLTFITEVVMQYLFVRLIPTFPLAYSDDYSFFRAMSYSLHVSQNNNANSLLYALLYSLAKVGLAVACIFISSQVLHVVLYSVFYLFVICVLPVWAFKMYYDGSGNERRDLADLMF